jgi:parallel beta-helix repeat protein
LNNSIQNNDLIGIGLKTGSNNNTLVNNNISSNFEGIASLDSINNAIVGNVLSSNSLVGVYISNTNDLICENIITYNHYGIYFYESVGNHVHFNQIFGNMYGLFSELNSHTVNATNNWWGNNTLNVKYTDTPADIIIYGGTVIYNPWIVLTVDPTSYKVAKGKVYESTITAELIYNSNGEDTSLQGCMPDGIPVYFYAQYGTITNPLYTKNGKASSTLVLDPNQPVTGVIAAVDDQMAYTEIDRSANAIIRITSTAIDSSTNQQLNINYTLPLNDSVSWVSVLWKNTGLFQNRVDVIVNGNVVLSRTVVNSAYLTNQASYSVKVFNTILNLNGILESDINLQNYITQNPQCQNYTINQLEDYILAKDKQQYNLTNSEINFIKNNRNKFIDTIYTLMTYPGDIAKYTTLTDPYTNETLSFITPGNPILRASPMIYYNGYTEDGDAGYEGVRSFAIATTKVTDSVMNYWLNKKSLYAPGAMKAAYGTFLTSLLVIKCHDMVADQAASEFNVTWSRTTPIAVSCCDDTASTYITGEMDHRMGMDVTGDAANVWAFRFACSSAFSPIEHMVAASSTGSSLPNGLSVTLRLGEHILNGETPELYYSNGYLVYKIQGKDDIFLLLDPETGIVTDCALGIHGMYCYHDLITDQTIQLGETLTSNDPNVQPVWLGVVGTGVIAAGSSEAIIGGGVLSAEILAAGSLGGLVGLAVALDVILTIQYPDIMVPVNLKALPGLGPLLSIYSLQSIMRGQGEPLTPDRLEDSYYQAASFLMSITESDYESLYNVAKNDVTTLQQRTSDWVAEKIGTKLLPPPPKKGDKAAFLQNLYDKSKNLIESGISDYKAGNYVMGTAKITLGTGGVYLWGSVLFYEIWPEGVWPKS